MLLVFIVTCICYGLVFSHLHWALVNRKPISKAFSLGGLIIGSLGHALVLYPKLITTLGINFNVFNMVSFTCLLILWLSLIFSSYRPVLSLNILAIPIALIGLIVGFFFTAPYAPLANIHHGLEAHIVLSLAAYCILFMSAVQAAMLRFQIRELKHQTAHRFWVNKLPALQTMEALLFDMILLGFVVLTLALAIGFVLLDNIFAQHLVHKTVFSLISWLIFGALLFGHWQYGWRGNRAANMTIYGFILLLVGFIGTKVVLELILK